MSAGFFGCVPGKKFSVTLARCPDSAIARIHLDAPDAEETILSFSDKVRDCSLRRDLENLTMIDAAEIKAAIRCVNRQAFGDQIPGSSSERHFAGGDWWIFRLNP